MENLFNKRKHSFIFILVLVFLGLFITAKAFIPSELSVRMGQTQNFLYNMPLVAKFSPEAQNVLSINNKPVENNINLSDSVSIKASNVGKFSVQLSLFGILPVENVDVSVVPEKYLIPCGNVVGVKVSTAGIMVLGTGTVSAENGANIEPAKNILRSGDMILAVNDKPVKTKTDLTEFVEQSDGEDVILTINRDSETIREVVKPILCSNDNKYKIGVWVRDAAGGIGTVTYYDPETKKFGALGHGILDVDTKQLMNIKDGTITQTKISSINKGKKGDPGELVGSADSKDAIGSIRKNTAYGVYGTLEDTSVLPQEKFKVGLKSEVYEGDAKILSTISGSETKEYDIKIESVNKFTNNESKGMVIRIVDEELISNTGGIVQGMSGSPIIQDGKLIGAVTHVFVQDPTKGYGIFLESMLKQDE